MDNTNFSDSDSCGGEGTPPVPAGGFFAQLIAAGADPRELLKDDMEFEDERLRIEAEQYEADALAAGKAAELVGDWSWRPDRQVKDPGYVFSADEIALMNESLELSRAFGTTESAAMQFANKVIPPRPWMVPAYVPNASRPPRIGSIR